MKNVILKLFGSVVTLIMGLAMLEDVLKDPLDEIGGTITLSAFCMIFVLFGIVIGWQGLQEARLLIWRSRGKRASEVIKNEIAATLLPDFTTVGDADETERQLSSFREHYRKFFLEDGSQENASIQHDVTQIFRNILELQRLRLSRKNVSLDFSSERKRYGDAPVKTAEEFDGKYEIRDINEDIAAKSVFSCGNRKIFQRVSAETAHYTVIHAKQVGKDSIICPNCGARTNRFRLLDGCDFCGTKFTVEDLGAKISDFSLQKNAEAEYKKYAAFRNKTNLWVGTLVGLAALLFSSYWVVPITYETAQTGEMRLLMNLMTSMLTILFFTAIAVYFGVLFFDLLILPIMQAGASARYLVNRIRDKRKHSENALFCLDKIRAFDPLFSFANFSSGLTNKLATIIYADTKQQAEAFFDGVRNTDIARYQDVIDIDVLEVEPVDYAVQNGMQHLLIKTSLNLVEYNGTRCRQRLERIRIHLEKSERCKTQAVCAPSLMSCKGCGIGRSILDGKTCPQCGNELDLRQYDWVIQKMEYGRWRV